MAMQRDPRVPASPMRIIVEEQFRFPAGSFAVDPKYAGLLNLGVIALKSLPEARLVVTGYTDNQGSADVNQSLSEQRATGRRRLDGQGRHPGEPHPRARPGTGRPDRHQLHGGRPPEEPPDRGNARGHHPLAFNPRCGEPRWARSCGVAPDESWPTRRPAPRLRIVAQKSIALVPMAVRSVGVGWKTRTSVPPRRTARVSRASKKPVGARSAERSDGGPPPVADIGELTTTRSKPRPAIRSRFVG